MILVVLQNLCKLAQIGELVTNGCIIKTSILFKYHAEKKLPTEKD